MRREARLDTDRTPWPLGGRLRRLRGGDVSADDDKQRLAAQRAAAIALSEHINESLLEPPLVE